MTYQIDCLEELGTFQVGEGPHWDVETQSLYFIDVYHHSIHKYTPSTNVHTSVNLDKKISFFIPIKGRPNQFLAGMCDEINTIIWDGVSSDLGGIETLTKLEIEETTLNDGKCDKLGNLWTGSYSSKLDIATFTPIQGCLYSLDCCNKKLRSHANNVAVSNGISFCNDLRKLYFIDSYLKTVDQFDYNPEIQAVENRQTLFTFEKHSIEGWPDGLTTDVDGNLWVAMFQGSKVVKIGTTKPETLLDIINIRTDQQVTSVSFGGQNLDELYVTTAGLRMTGADNDKPVNGYLYKITNLGTKGSAGCKVKV